MKLIDKTVTPYLGQYDHVWLADNEDEITADFDSGGGDADMILDISTGAVWMKNSEGKWQKVGTTEVKA